MIKRLLKWCRHSDQERQVVSDADLENANCKTFKMMPIFRSRKGSLCWQSCQLLWCKMVGTLQQVSSQLINTAMVSVLISCMCKRGIKMGPLLSSRRHERRNLSACSIPFTLHNCTIVQFLQPEKRWQSKCPPFHLPSPPSSIGWRENQGWRRYLDHFTSKKNNKY